MLNACNPGSNAGLQGSDADISVASNSTTLGPVSSSSSANDIADNKAKTNESEDVGEIDKLLGVFEVVEQQLAREEGDVEIPGVDGVETPTQEQADRHESIRTPYKRWCMHCNEWLGMRD